MTAVVTTSLHLDVPLEGVNKKHIFNIGGLRMYSVHTKSMLLSLYSTLVFFFTWDELIMSTFQVIKPLLTFEEDYPLGK